MRSTTPLPAHPGTDVLDHDSGLVRFDLRAVQAGEGGPRVVVVACLSPWLVGTDRGLFGHEADLRSAVRPSSQPLEGWRVPNLALDVFERSWDKLQRHERLASIR
jgi:hypothetical protein